MTIQEAIKSGKWFRRPRHRYDMYKVIDNRLWCAWLDYSEEPPLYQLSDPEYSGFESLNAEDILADDWEVVENEIS